MALTRAERGHPKEIGDRRKKTERKQANLRCNRAWSASTARPVAAFYHFGGGNVVVYLFVMPSFECLTAYM